MQEVEMRIAPDKEAENKQIALQKTIDMMEWAENALQKFPKYARFTRAADITRCMDRIMERAIEANKMYYKKTTLRDLDVEIEKLRKYVFLSYRLKYLPYRKYRLWSEKVDEIGRIVGSWIKSTKK